MCTIDLRQLKSKKTIQKQEYIGNMGKDQEHVFLKSGKRN